jgi:hypothetical protein
MLFYFMLRVGNTRKVLGMAAVYSAPDEYLLQASYNTVWSYTHGGDAGIKVVDVKHISSVVAIIPHPKYHGPRYENRFFVVEKPGLEVAVMGGVVEDLAEDDVI